MRPKLVVIDREVERRKRVIELIRAQKLTLILLRLERGWTRKRQAKETHVPLEIITRFETMGWAEITWEEYAHIFRTLGLRPSTFMELHDRLTANGKIRSYLARDSTLRIVPRDIKKLKQLVRDFFEEKNFSWLV